MLLPILLLTGCPQPCVGAACGELYPRARLRVFSGAGLSEESALESPDIEAWGAEVLGNEWALAGDADGLWVGLPGADQVRRLSGDDLATGNIPELPTGDGAPAGVAYGETSGSGFGAALSTRLDAGARTLVVGAPATGEGTAGAALGRAWRWSGLDAAPEGDLLVADATASWGGERAWDQLGTAVAACGDLDGDGLDDQAATAAWGEQGGTLSGDVVLFVGEAARTLPGTGPAAVYGRALWCAGDLDGDGLAELLVGAPGGTDDRDIDSGLVELRAGGAVDEVALTLFGTVGAERFGSALAVGDFDGDGRGDLAVGAPGGNSPDGGNDTAGAVYVWLNRRTPLDRVFGEEADLVLQGEDPHGQLGHTLLAADLDGDGVDELVAGAPGVNPTGAADAVSSGRVYVFYGLAAEDGPQRSVVLESARQFLRAGERLAAAELDGDGVLDLVVLTREPAE